MSTMGIYKGHLKHLQGKRAIIEESTKWGFCLAQFEDMSLTLNNEPIDPNQEKPTGNELGFGLHLFTEMEFELWQTIDTAPRDGTEFEGLNQTTGNSYVTWYEPKFSNDKLSELFAERFGMLEDGKVVWWCKYKDRVTSFFPTHWRPIKE